MVTVITVVSKPALMEQSPVLNVAHHREKNISNNNNLREVRGGPWVV